MQDVAELAKIPIGSLYQFFPDRNALVAKMFSDLLKEEDEHLEQTLSGIETIAEFESATAGLVEGLYIIAKKKAAYVEIWRSLQALPTIRHMEEENSRKNAKMLSTILRRFASPLVSEQQIQNACLLVASLLSAVIQLSLNMPPKESKGMVREYDTMTRTYIRSLLT